MGMNFYSKQLARDLVCENSSIYIVCLFRLILLLIHHQQTVVEQLMQHIKWEAITLPGCMDSRKVIGPDFYYRFETCCEMHTNLLDSIIGRPQKGNEIFDESKRDSHIS